MRLARQLLCLLIGTALGCGAMADQHEACDAQAHCAFPVQAGKLIADSDTRTRRSPPPNTERQTGGIGRATGECAAQAPTERLPFTISVDGVPLDKEAPAAATGEQRCTDLAANRAQVQIRYDSHEQTPWLNVHATPNTVGAGESVSFVSYTNYPAWITQAEVRLFRENKTVRQQPFQRLPIDPLGITHWRPTEGLSDSHDSITFVLRVYDDKGRFDETEPKPLKSLPARLEQPTEEGELAGYGENSRHVANIPVSGGAVTVNGSNIKPGDRVDVMGIPIPVGKGGKFAVRQILPAGPHDVTVSVRDADRVKAEFTRHLDIASDDWFYVGLADLTVGRNKTDGPVKLVTTDESDQYDDKVYVNGRLAFYLKGKIEGKYLLTAAADTREQPFDDLFSNFAEKDPRHLLRRLDPERYYPVYGDDSTTLEDAPTQGRFFVRLERGDSQILWGNFHTSITGTEFANYMRGLYGARVKLVSPESTRYGERRGQIELFGADPGSLSARDEFRGTGGSLYSLRRQDLTQGSERAWIEVRDKVTGLVLETRYLTPVDDYDINYLQGRLILHEPLSSTADDGLLVSSGSLSGHPAYLVVTYEYTPGLSAADDLVRGGRAQLWVNDKVGLGLSAYKQDAPGTEQEITEGDITLRYKPGTYLKLEKARSDGPGSGANSSIDGGFNFQSRTAIGGKADADRIEAAVDFDEVTEAQQGGASIYWQKRDAGFSSPGQITGDEAVEQQGANLEWQITERVELRAKLDDRDRGSDRVNSGEINAQLTLDEQWKLGIGVRADDREPDSATASDELEQEGKRTDAVLRADYTPELQGEEAEWSAYGYTQGTLDRDNSRDRNNRIGIGGKRRFSRRFDLSGEISTGDGGLGALARGDYHLDDRSTLYLGYQLTTDRTDSGYRGREGTLTSGARSRFSDSVSVFGEERYQHGDGPSGLTHAFGIDLAPGERWSYGIDFEAGDINDPDAGDLSRRAVSLSMGYVKEKTKYAGNLEYRREDGSNGRRITWLMRNTLGYQIDPDWRFIGKANFSFSDASDGNFYDGDYVEGSLGYAYRPVDSDRLNALLKYTYLYDLPAADQLTGNGELADFAQRSHVLAADATYDLRPWVSIGGKYGYRLGEMRDNRISGPWADSEAWLGVVRADFHWVHKWDLLIEGRRLEVRAADDSRSGILAAAYRHVGQNMKIGVGYNFADFSDDLTDLSYDAKGWFINLVGKL